MHNQIQLIFESEHESQTRTLQLHITNISSEIKQYIYAYWYYYSSHYIIPSIFIMVLEGKEDQTAPISQSDVAKLLETNQDSQRTFIVDKILAALNEKRDAYNGIVSSIILISDCGDVSLIGSLKGELIKSITVNPMQYAGKMFLSKALTRLSKERPKFVIDLFEEIVEKTPTWSIYFKDDCDVLRLQVIAIKAIRQAEEQQKSRATTISADEIYEICIKAANLGDDRTKIDTLNLVLACRSTTKPITDREFRLYETLYESALSLQEPALRQIFLSETGKFLFRLKESLRVIMRDRRTLGEEVADQYRVSYAKFVTWLVSFSFDNIYCNAYFGSFRITISTLKLVIAHITYTNPYLPIMSLFKDRRCYDSLLSCLNDSFEENKATALELMLSLPFNEQFINEDNIKSFEDIASGLIASINPAHSLTCQYVYRLIIGLRLKQQDNKLSKNELLHQKICNLTQMVELNIKDTKENFVDALSKRPIYPKLTCIRALLNDLEVENFDQNRIEWSSLAKKVVSLSIEACQAVSSVVCNLNPETIGHLPMDLKPMSVDALADTLKVSVNVSSEEVNTISSQMLLISGWKTIKECSLSLGAICVRFWWPRKTNQKKSKFVSNPEADPILQPDDILSIIKFFDHYLRNLRHRGAFEQAYNGFLMVTQHIWQDEVYRKVLVDLLEEIMNDFRNDALDEHRADRLKAYVTRRSAGLPFIVQAILNSEHEHDSKTLRMVMKCLLEVLESPDSEEFQKIHCLNILKALTKESYLGEKMLTYVGPIFNVALDSFKSDSFPIRNCASMLLKAAVDRTFGINRLSDDIHRRNQLSFERFFISCPGLHAKMLDHLKDGLENKKYLASVHSIFIILFRLVPSIEPSEDYSHDKIIRPFVEPTIELAFTCHDFKLRGIAAKLAVRLESFCMDKKTENPKAIDQAIVDTMAGITLHATEDTDRNRLHGALSMLRHWIDCATIPLALQGKVEKLGKETVNYIVKSDLKSVVTNIIKAAALDIVESLLLKQPGDVDWLTEVLRWCVEFVTESTAAIAITATTATAVAPECATNDIAATPPTPLAMEPHYETLLFKSITLILMGAFYDEYSLQEPQAMRRELDRIEGLNKLLNLLPDLISRPSNRYVSKSFQGSLIRLMRQVIGQKPTEQATYANNKKQALLLDRLDMDLTANFMTPYDKLKLKVDNDSERDKWLRFCRRRRLARHMWKTKFAVYEMLPFACEEGEMDELKVENRTVQGSNTPRAVESFALGYDIADITQFKVSMWRMNVFLEALPDCDVKCVGLVFASKIVKRYIQKINDDLPPGLTLPCHTGGGIDFSIPVRFSLTYCKMVCELANGDRDVTTRTACAIVLQELLVLFVKHNPTKKNSFQEYFEEHINYLFSALIKLTQDEDAQIRSVCHRIMLDLPDFSKFAAQNSTKIGSLINYLTDKIYGRYKYPWIGYRPGDYVVDEVCERIQQVAVKVQADDDEFYPPPRWATIKYFKFIMGVLVNDSSAFTGDLNQERNQLFDKTRLNTYADRVSTIYAVLETLQRYLVRPYSKGKIPFEMLELPESVMRELNVVKSLSSNDCGDYGWRKKGRESTDAKTQLLNGSGSSEAAHTCKDCDIYKFFEQLLENLYKSLDYFNTGYHNMLTEPEYTQHELLLLQQVAFVKYVTSCTRYMRTPVIEEYLPKIREKLEHISKFSCSTTMFRKITQLML